MLSAQALQRAEELAQWHMMRGDYDEAHRIACLVTPRGYWFAWRPVRALQADGVRRWVWLRMVFWKRVMRGPTEYSDLRPATFLHDLP